MIRPTDEPLRTTDLYDAEDDVMRDMDAFADWLGGECFGHGAVSSEWVERIPDVRIPQADVPVLLHIMVTSADLANAAKAAAELRKRYLARPECVARVREIAGEWAMDRREPQ